ncbi:MAG: PEP-CTERM sorting domain-containing protein [Thermodesulfobacteriota bacterium]
MKKLLSAAIFSAMVLGTASQAAAYFEQGDLLLSVYNRVGTDYETVVDLGNTYLAANGAGTPVSLIDFNAQDVTLAAAGTINFAAHGVALSDLTVNAHAYNLTTVGGTQFNGFVGYAASIQTDAARPNTGVYNGLNSNTTAVLGTYRPAGTQAVFSGTMEYDKRINGNQTADAFYVGFPSGSGTNKGAKLTDLASVGYVDLYLYQYAANAANGYSGALVRDAAGHDWRAKLRLTSDGGVILNPSAVPVPASVLLLGSGLLGLLGIRRKEA